MDSKVLIIGDIHGRDNWQYLIRDFDKYDHVVVMGDYFDPYEHVEMDKMVRVFRSLINLKKNYIQEGKLDKLILLFGNHDYHYLSDVREKYGRYDFTNCYVFRKELEQALEENLLQVAWQLPGTNIVFTHAAISSWWYNHRILGRTWKDEEIQEVELNQIPELVRILNTTLYSHKQAFQFGDASWDVYGYDFCNGPLWWRLDPRNLKGRLRGIFQVNGHTQQEQLTQGEEYALVDLLRIWRVVELEVKEEALYSFKEIIIKKHAENSDQV